MAREKLFKMRMSEEESARLDAVRKHYGLNASGAIRMLIKEKYDAFRWRYIVKGLAAKRLEDAEKRREEQEKGLRIVWDGAPKKPVRAVPVACVRGAP